MIGANMELLLAKPFGGPNVSCDGCGQTITENYFVQDNLVFPSYMDRNQGQEAVVNNYTILDNMLKLASRISELEADRTFMSNKLSGLQGILAEYRQQAFKGAVAHLL
jgi:hypothetical protein